MERAGKKVESQNSELGSKEANTNPN